MGGEWFTVDMVPDIPLTCKVRIIEKRPPLTIKIKYQNSKGKISIYGSFKHKVPGEDRN